MTKVVCAGFRDVKQIKLVFIALVIIITVLFFFLLLNSSSAIASIVNRDIEASRV